MSIPVHADDGGGRLTDLICGTPEMNAVWSMRQSVQSMLDVEAALARACAAHGVIPQQAVAPIVATCDVARIDIPALVASTATAGNLAIPLVRQLTARVAATDPDAAKYVHWGATSQDIIDTAVVLQLGAALALLEPALARLGEVLARQAVRHRDTPMIGRTWLQQALPITLGLKFAQWLDGVGRHRARLAQIRVRCLALQFGGAAGTLASLRERGGDVAATLAADLGLTLPDVPWHTQRDRIVEAGAGFGMLIGSLGKIARDISLHMQTEVGELAEPAAAGKGGSSTMPHKRNPVGCAAALSAAMRAPHLVGMLFGGMVQEHERALGGWQAEWEALPELARLAGGALAQITAIVTDIEVDTDRLARNLALTDGLIMGEAVMLALGDRIGRLDAHTLVEHASHRAIAERRALFDVLSEDATVSRHLSRDQLTALLDPANYVGRAHAFVDAVVAHHHRL